MTGWLEFIAAFSVFFLSHAIPVRPAVKGPIVAQVGAAGFAMAYSVLAVGVLAWLIGAAARAPHVVLWGWAPWQNHVPLTAMLVATLIVALAIGRPNPLSFGGARNDQFDPQNPGIVGWLRHPLLVALAIWAFAHIVPNGDVAHVILFAVFGGFALLGMIMIDRRKRRVLGAQHWAGLVHTQAQLRITRFGLIRLGVGLLIYAVLLTLHGAVFGVSPLA